MDVLKTAILEMCRKRGEASFCPSEVVRQLYPEDWRNFMDEVRAEAMTLYRLGEILVTQAGIAVDPQKEPNGPIRISKPK
ncbi:DUF3253 domain-containing protein [Algoriphagus hitonicola]|uniref:DUF3253 domain-containing protein n=1 Tax=Algoriphagus hitonicola TaxID=435880 RepID=A0A1I2R789_9BACT|nr:DUF3253 domain-containing protein [Algoriphagus hitonicola]SFG36594.1 Protein of unknown function [Algoriphagus hitonicola]